MPAHGQSARHLTRAHHRQYSEDFLRELCGRSLGSWVPAFHRRLLAATTSAKVKAALPASKRVYSTSRPNSLGSVAVLTSNGTTPIPFLRAILISFLTPGPPGVLLVHITKMNLLSTIAAGIFLPHIRDPVLISGGAM